MAERTRSVQECIDQGVKAAEDFSFAAQVRADPTLLDDPEVRYHIEDAGTDPELWWGRTQAEVARLGEYDQDEAEL